MGVDIGGAIIAKNAGGGVTLNSALVFNALGQGAANPIPGFSGWKIGGSTYYSGGTGWEVNEATWQYGLTLGNGVFTCPVAGLYAMGYNGIHRGGSGIPAGYNTYGYGAFAKNGAMSYWIHWNQGPNTYWNTGGCSALFSCQAGDWLALFINQAPVDHGPDVYSQNYGLYPDQHHCVWCKLVG
jgi:hypothetical protein